MLELRTWLRQLFGLPEGSKRARDADDDGPPSMKKYRTVRSHFPKIMPVENEDDPVFFCEPRPTSKIRYIPITREESPFNNSSILLKSNMFPRDHSSPKPLHRFENSRDSQKLFKQDNIASCSCDSRCTIHTKTLPYITNPSRTERFFNGSRENYFKEPLPKPACVIDLDDDDDSEDECKYVSQTKSDIFPNEKSLYKNNKKEDSTESDSECEVICIKHKKNDKFNKYIKVKRESPRKSYLQTLHPQNSFNFKRKSKSGAFPKLKSYKGTIGASFRLDEKRNFEELINKTKANFLPKSFYARQLQHKLLSTTSSITENEKPVVSYIDLTEFNSEKDKNTQNKIFGFKASDDSNSFKNEINQVIREKQNSAEDERTSIKSYLKRRNDINLAMRQKTLINDSWLEDLNKKYDGISLQKESSIEKIEIEDESLPEIVPLTKEQEAKIDSVIHSYSSNTVVNEKFNQKIHLRDIHTLMGLNWLNDEVINFYMNLIMERSQQKKNLPKVYGMNTFFFPKLIQSGHAGLKRWTRKVDIFSNDLMIVPIHLGVHWCMSIIDMKHKNIHYYDSMGGRNVECCMALLKYLEDECMDKKREKLDKSLWKWECVKDIPQQMNGSDCGMFSCMFAEYISRNAPITFTQNDMPYFRRKMILEIIQGQLLL